MHQRAHHRRATHFPQPLLVLASQLSPHACHRKYIVPYRHALHLPAPLLAYRLLHAARLQACFQKGLQALQASAGPCGAAAPSRSDRHPLGDCWYSSRIGALPPRAISLPLAFCDTDRVETSGHCRLYILPHLRSCVGAMASIGLLDMPQGL